jgi:hypothetical protein
MKRLHRALPAIACVAVVGFASVAYGLTFPSLHDTLDIYLRVPGEERDTAIHRLLASRGEPRTQSDIAFYNGCLVMGELLTEAQQREISLYRALQMCDEYEFSDWIQSQRARR